MEKGSLSINSENLLPIIKKWLYSDTDIFLRELVSNGCDAVNKLKKLVTMGEAEDKGAYKITVSLDKENKTIIVSDNGIGMTADEIKEYINQIAFSGANSFIEKYKDQIGGENDIIGHFGLGFYSAFMVAERVEIDSLSYVEGAKPAHWSCDGGIEFELDEGVRTERGTDIILHISEESKEFLNPYKIKEILTKYCYFMPVEIYFEDLDEQRKEAAEAATEEIKEGSEGVTEAEEKKPEPVNDVSPLWLKNPGDCTDEEYKSFYHKVFTDFNDPLFWIHLNMDYPFKLKGILYFPKLKRELDAIEGQVKLYNNQVFIADNIKEVIPEFLLLLKGTIDCPDLPLNVSRSFLQNDGYVGKISKYIVKKVADKLNSLFKKDRETYETNWEDINTFIKYGCLRDKDFYEKVKGSLIYRSINGGYKTLNEYLEANADKFEKKVFYVSDEKQQAQYVSMFKENDLEAVVLDNQIDVPYVNYMEMYNEGVQFLRIDSDINEVLKSGDADKDTAEKLEKLFKDVLGKESLTVKVEKLKADNVSAMIELSEQSRRMMEMSKLYGFGSDMPMAETLILNADNNVIKLLLSLDENDKENIELVVKQVYDLAAMSHRPLSAEELTDFLDRSNKVLALACEKSEK
ncbi:MAG: molecular chaperone HtpG [Clostridiales bacterium]|nr:molecular chaperone HtpG [Clostridiales bacterium]